MDVREKLVELLTDNLPRCGNLPSWDNPLQLSCDEQVQRIADHLIMNGVTVQGWISVDDRLPDDNDRVIAFRPNEPEISAYKYCVMWGWSVKASLKHRGITHWKPMPQPQKGE